MIVIIAIMILVSPSSCSSSAENAHPVQYAKRVVGRRMMGGQSTHMPLKVNAGGVIPVILRRLCWPSDDGPEHSRCPEQQMDFGHVTFHGHGRADVRHPVRCADRFLLVLLRSIIFNPNEAADNMRRYGGFIPASGRQEHRRLHEWNSEPHHRGGGLYLAILSIIPTIMIGGIKLQHLPPAALGNFIDAHFPRFLLDGLGVTFYFGGTSLLIVVGVAMDTVNQVEAQLIMPL